SSASRCATTSPPPRSPWGCSRRCGWSRPARSRAPTSPSTATTTTKAVRRDRRAPRRARRAGHRAVPGRSADPPGVPRRARPRARRPGARRARGRRAARPLRGLPRGAAGEGRMAVEALADEVEALFHGARRVARRSGHARVDAAHVLLAALEPPPDELRGALAAARIDIALLRDRVERRLGELPRGVAGDEAVELADAIRPLLRVAGERAARRGPGPVRAVDVIDALLAAPALAEAVHETGADVAAL